MAINKNFDSVELGWVDVFFFKPHKHKLRHLGKMHMGPVPTQRT